MANVLSTAKTAGELDQAFKSAKKALSVLGIDMKLKDPDPTRLKVGFDKKKDAVFRLDGDAKMLKVVVECGAASNALGMLDVQAEKDAKRRLALMQAMVKHGLISAADLKSAEKALAGPDPKVVAALKAKVEAAEKEIIATKKIYDGFNITFDWDKIKKSGSMLNFLQKQAKKELSTENILFRKAIDAKMDHKKLMENFISDSAKFQVNVNGNSKKMMESKTEQLTPQEYKDLASEADVNMSDTWTRALADLKAEMNTRRQAAEKVKASASAELKELGVK